MTEQFELVLDEECLVVVPMLDLRETVFDGLCEETSRILDELGKMVSPNVVVDFHRTQEFGSTAIGYFVTLWKRISERNGHLAFCNLSPFELDILRVTKLDQLWSICKDRAYAIHRVRELSAPHESR